MWLLIRLNSQWLKPFLIFGIAMVLRMPSKAQIGMGDKIGQSVFAPVVIGTASLPKCEAGSNCQQTGCPLYIFIGKGDWRIPGNWANGDMPPDKLPSCYQIVIDPMPGQTAVLPKPITMLKGSNFVVAPGKTLVVPFKVIIGQ
jgi:hypothetical protein